MSLSTTGVDTFQIQHPSYDGRGVMILIFDTGVDPSIPGLEKTSTGLPKVVDLYDFANSNVVRFKPAKVTGSGDDRRVAVEGLTRPLTGIASLVPQPLDPTVYTGWMDESIYRNSSVRDFDGDGEATSKFALLLYRSSEGWRVVLDADNDGNLTGDTPIGNYAERRETVQFKQKSGGKSPLTLGARIDTVAHTVSFHYDMGGHGTHVAGIASGFGINREPGFNGVAPGAQIISCKFSGDTADDNTVTGSMKRAYDFAARLADSLAAQRIPVVVNMSFGIGSALEGRADIEYYIDSLIPSHPNLYVVTSAGNEGPGLSTTGIPSSASRIITVGALLPKGIGRDGYNAALDRDIIWDFSSRGGEVDKPDVLAPGTAVSTVPRYAFESRESGTSMSSPYTAGVVAVLLSAMRQEDSTWVPGQELIRRALRSGAHLLPEYAMIEQGGGLIDVRKSYELLRQYRSSGFADDVQNYIISTFSPNYPDGRGTTAFWRSAYVPGAEWRQTFKISRYIPSSSRKNNEEFFRPFTLESTADWLRPVQSTVYLRNRNDAEVDVLYDREKLKAPGLYSGRIIARRASAKGPAPTGEVEFELVNTVIVPWLFSADKGYKVTTPSQTIPAGVTTRFYFAPPAGASAISFTLSVPKDSNGHVTGQIADRRGEIVGYLSRAKGGERAEGTILVPTSTLGDGVIEVIVQADAYDGPGGPSEFTLSAEAVMLSVTPTVEGPAGKARDLTIMATNTGTTPMEGDFSYTIKGYIRTLHDTMRSDSWSIPLTINPTDGALWVKTSFSDEAYMRSTDILIRIIDGEGNVQAEEGMNTLSTLLFLPNFNRGETTHLRLQVVYGATFDGKFPPTPITITESHMRPSDPHSLGGYGGVDLYPFIPVSIEGGLPNVFDTPAGYRTLGEVTWKARGSGDAGIGFEFTVP